MWVVVADAGAAEGSADTEGVERIGDRLWQLYTGHKVVFLATRDAGTSSCVRCVTSIFNRRPPTTPASNQRTSNLRTSNNRAR